MPELERNQLWQWWESESRQTRRLKKGEVLFRRNQTVTAIHRVERGLLRLERRTFDGRLLVLRDAGVGELLAEAALFSQTYHCDASAAQPSVVSICARSRFLEAMSNDARLAMAFARLVARQLQSVRQRLELRNVRSAGDRIMLYLELYADPESSVLDVSGPLQDIAAELGLTREAFYRSLAALERRGLIKRSKGKILIRRRSA